MSLTESVAAGLSLSEGLFPQVEGEVVISQVGGDEAGKVGGFRSSRRRARSPGQQREDPGEPFFVTRFAGPQFPETRGKRQLRTRLSLFVPSTLYSLAADDHHPLVGAALRGWERFAGLVPSDVADAVAVIHSDPGPLANALVARGTTLTARDLWLVNAALQPHRTVLLDWGLATEAPGAVDFATFLMRASAVAASRDDLVDDVRRIRGSQHDEIALRLALLAAVADLGSNKALDATEHSDSSIRDRETAELSWWVQAARSGLDAGLC